nr:hypothetical protein [Conexibacter sp. W3-3-2]
MPVEKHPGDDVVGATVNVGGRLVLQATKIGSDTALAQIARLVRTALVVRHQTRSLALGTATVTACRSP